MGDGAVRYADAALRWSGVPPVPPRVMFEPEGLMDMIRGGSEAKRSVPSAARCLWSQTRPGAGMEGTIDAKEPLAELKLNSLRLPEPSGTFRNLGKMSDSRLVTSE